MWIRTLLPRLEATWGLPITICTILVQPVLQTHTPTRCVNVNLFQRDCYIRELFEDNANFLFPDAPFHWEGPWIKKIACSWTEPHRITQNVLRHTPLKVYSSLSSLVLTCWYNLHPDFRSPFSTCIGQLQGPLRESDICIVVFMYFLTT